jgi:N-acetylmuramoyl-L-alanine amidase
MLKLKVKGTILAGFFAVLLPFRTVPAPAIEIYGLRCHTHPNFTRIVLDIGAPCQYTFTESRKPDQIHVDIYRVKLNPILEGQSPQVKNDYISQILLVHKTATTIRLSCDLDFGKIASYRVWHLFDPFRIVLDIYPKTAVPAGPVENLARTPKPLDSGYTMARQLGLGIRTIVIDPGHGGLDPGCIGKKGVQEKDVVLDISLKLKNLLSTHKDLQVILTRESDIYVALEDRPVIANQKKADLFVSIHANASFNRKRSGVETFFLNFSPDASVNEIAARENATSTKNISEMKSIIMKIVQNSKLLESKDVAEKINRDLLKSLLVKHPGVKDLGVKGGPFWVLIGSDMPSVLVEVSHLSNPAEEALLITQAYEDLIAKGIYDGIMEYIHSLGKG